MTRSTLRIMLLCAPLMIGCGGRDATEDSKKTATELLVGTWTRVTVDGRSQPWWTSQRMEFQADGTFRFTSNDPYLLIWKTPRAGRYEITDRVIRYSTPVTTEDEENNRKCGFEHQYHGTWSETIASITENELAVFWERAGNRVTRGYRRVN